MAERELETSRKETFDERQNANQLWLELKRLKPMVEELKNRNIELEMQLADSQTRYDMQHVDSKTSVEMLKSHIRFINHEKLEMRRTRDIDDKTLSVIERKHRHLQDISDRMKAENKDLKMQNFDLNNKLAQIQKKYDNLKVQFRRWTESATKLMEMKETVKPENKLPPIAGAEESGGLSSLTMRLNTIEKEREYLMSNNAMLKNRVDDLSTKVSHLEKQLEKTTSNNSHLRQSLEQMVGTVKQLVRRTVFIERAASYLERTVKEYSPNSKFDYKAIMREHARELSVQMVSALNVSGTTADDIDVAMEESRLLKDIVA